MTARRDGILKRQESYSLKREKVKTKADVLDSRFTHANYVFSLHTCTSVKDSMITYLLGLLLKLEI